ncbi:MAG: polysaccharide biosynthesis protein [Clostridiales bacterium]|nr:polysaccharide biosynthesis protein [Clostridiales bacterium]
MKKSKNFFYGAGMLALCSVVSKILGASFRIPLTNILGAEGMGIYQIVFPLYAVLLTLSSGGLPVAISRVVATRCAKNQSDSSGKILCVALIAMTIIGFLITLIVLIFHRAIATVQGNHLASLAYLGIAPAIVFVAVIGVFRGYFQGKQNLLPSSISQLVEQATKLIVGISLSINFMQYGVEFAVLGAVLGVTLSEAVAMIVLILFFIFGFISQKKSRLTQSVATHFDMEVSLDWNIDEFANSDKPLQTKTESVKSILKTVYKVAMPVSIGALILPMTQVVDSIIVINFLISGGASRAVATAQYGIVNGPVSSLINLPVVMTMAIAIALLPKVTDAFTRGEDTHDIVSTAMRQGLLLAMPAFIATLLYAQDIMHLLYGSGLSATELSQGVQILQISAVIILYATIVQLCTAVLQGYNQAAKPAYILAMGAVVKIATTVLLLYFLGIYGVAIATVIFYIIAVILNIYAVRKKMNISIFAKDIFKIFIASLVSILTGLLVKLIVQNYLPNFAALAVAIFISIALYLYLCILLGCILKEEYKIFTKKTNSTVKV